MVVEGDAPRPRRPASAAPRSVEDKAADILSMARALVVAPGARGGRRCGPATSAAACHSSEAPPMGVRDAVLSGLHLTQRSLATLRSTEFESQTMRDLLAKQGSMDDRWRNPTEEELLVEKPHHHGGRRKKASPPRAASPRRPPSSKFERSASRRRGLSSSSSSSRTVAAAAAAAASEAREAEVFENTNEGLASIEWHATHGHGGAPMPAEAPAAAMCSLMSFGAAPAELRSEYDARFAGLQAYGASGMTRLEELVEAAMDASTKVVRAAKVEKRALARDESRCAALLARSGTVYVTRSVRCKTDPTLSVGCERAAVLRAVSDGDSAFQGLVVVDAASDAIPAPDGTARQFLAEYGDFPVYLVNKDLYARRISTLELYPMRSLVPVLDEARSDEERKTRRLRRSKLKLDLSKTGAASPGRKKKKKRRKKKLLQGASSSSDESDRSSERGFQRKKKSLVSSDEDSSPRGGLRRRTAAVDSDDSDRSASSGRRGRWQSVRRAVVSEDEVGRSDELSDDPESWTVEDVAEWLEFDLRFPEYAATFRRAQVNGALLLKVDGADLEETFGVKHTLHRRRILGAVSALQATRHMADRARVGASVEDLQGAFGQIDKERVRAVAKLKCAFDAFAMKRGEATVVDVDGARAALKQIGRDGDAWTADAATYTFLDFVDVYVANFSDADPDLKASSAKQAAISDRLRVLANGHVALVDSPRGSPSSSPSSGAALVLRKKKNKNKKHLDMGRGAAGASDDDGPASSGDESVRTRRRQAAKAAKAADAELGSVRRLAELKQTFDRFAVLDAVTGAEALQALTELGSSVPRKVAGKYFRDRGFYGQRRDVSFFEFLRAYAALEFEGDEARPRLATHGKKPSPPPRGLRRGNRSDDDDDDDDDDDSAVDRAVKRLARKPYEKYHRRRPPNGRGSCRSPLSSDSSAHSRRRASGGSRRGRSGKPRMSSRSRRCDSDSDSESSRGRPSRRRRQGGASSASDDHSAGETRRGRGTGFSSFSPHSPRHRAKKSKKRFDQGDPVNARFKKRTAYYRGVIARARPDDTYDIDYDDGEREKRVSAEYIEHADGDDDRKEPSSKRLIAEGDRVEADYRGRGKLYAGKVTRDRGDGTYEIHYDDGERESRVPAKLIKKASAARRGRRRGRRGRSSSDSSDSDDRPRRRSRGRLREGAKVEARFRGRSKYFPGNIARDRGDGTFDVAYDDGERESRVAEDLIKALEEEEDDGDGRDRKFRVDDRVEADYRGRGKYYPGRIARVHINKTYDIDYDDSEKEREVPAKYIRAMRGASSRKHAAADLLREGDKVEADYRGRGTYYKGKIDRDRGDGTYDVHYDDGERESRVEATLIRALRSPRRSGRHNNGLREGAKVEANYRGRGKFYKGKISRDRGDGTYDISYDDGEKESRVAEELIKSLDSDGSDDESPRRRRRRRAAALREGTKVEARYKGRAKYYKGKIALDRGDGTYDVDYDDGEKEIRVAEEFIRSLEEDDHDDDDRRGAPHGRGRLREGSKVEARYRGRSKYYKGKISRDRGDGTFDIAYDDGEEESRVAEELIRPLDGATVGGRGGGAELFEGDKVEANYRGRGKFYKGKIQRDRGDGTYDIFYDDGEKELRVDEKLIRSLDGGGGGGRGGSLREGDKVEADYRGRGKFYKGEISRDRGDGTFDIAYDDGEREARVDEKLIRPLGGGGRGGGAKLMEGDKVEANYRGRGKFYKGKIQRDRRDGTYDIFYDDGEKELRVDEKLIRSLDGGGGGGRGRLREGSKVEARYRGRSKYYKGKIARDRGDGTFDIAYDDGESETRVTEELIKALDVDDDAPRGRGRLREGEKVKADYRGRGKFYEGKIQRDRGDGTYDIFYDDGEKELRVDEKLIRSLDGGGGGGGRGGSLREGDKVEADYRGRGKFYKGEISRDRGDGTFDIAYDDGEREARVDEKLIRPLGGGGRGGGAKLMEGDKVEANYRGRGKFYKGKIQRDRRDGTYDIFYDDGEKELRVDEKLIRSLDGGGGGGRGRLREGSKVEARYRGRSKYYKGKIARDRGDGTFDIAYDDGESETRVAEEFIKTLDGDDDSPRGRGRLREGEKVEARYRGRSKYYPGKISRDRGDGTYDIAYDDGESETRVAAELIKGRGDGVRTSPRAGSALQRLGVGDHIEARYKGRAKWYKGKIARVHADGTFDIDYDDGEKEKYVLGEHVRALGGGGGSSSSLDSPVARGGDRLRVGDAIEARYMGRDKFYPGKVARDRFDGTFDVDYADGEHEARVDERLIRPLSPAAARAGGRRGKLRLGDLVEADYKGRGKFYPGKIARDRGDGTFDVDYDDGEAEARVEARRIQAVDGDAALASPRRDEDKAAALREGDTVEARYRGRTAWYKGKIQRCHRDGTYDILYDDGEREAAVKLDLIKVVEAVLRSPRRDDLLRRLDIGDKVEAKYKGRSRAYPGRVARVHTDGTFDIDYDDGEKERYVLAEYVKPLGAADDDARGDATPSRGRGRGRLREGAKVEARYRGRSKFYPGKIARDRGDGTFDVDYDDGESESRVAEDLIKPLGGGGGGGGLTPRVAVVSLRRGELVEARYRGRSKYYSGRIGRVNGDGTYDVDYDDGEQETAVKEHLIRSLDNAPSDGYQLSALD